jgi:hypothetical protein
MVDRQFIAARMVAATRRLGHPRIDAHYRSTI